MGLRRLLLVSIVAALALGSMGASCQDKAVAPYPKSDIPPESDNAVGPGDIFEVRVYAEPNLSGAFQVAPNGTIAYPLVGTITVAGMTASAIEDLIRTRLADGYLKNPQVSVFVKEYRSKKVRVFGQVRAPGTFPYTEDMSIVEAITRAGGFTALAKKNSVKVTRRAGDKTRVIFVAVEDIGRGKAPDFLLRPGDTVFVDERPF